MSPAEFSTHSAVAVDLLAQAGRTTWDEAGIAAFNARLAQLDRALADHDGDALSDVVVSIAVILRSAGERYGRRTPAERDGPQPEVSFPQQRVNELVQRLQEPRPEQGR